MSSEGRRRAAQVDDHIMDVSSHAANELSLCLRCDLKVETTEHELCGDGVVILHERTGDPHFGEG